MGDKQEHIVLSEILFKTLLENSHDAISICDKQFNVIYRNPSAIRITGYNYDERNDVGGIEQTHPDDITNLKLVMEKVLENPNKPISAKFRTKHKLGHYIWMEGLFTNKLEDENIRGIIINLKDVSEKILFEQNLQQHSKEISDYKYALDESSIVAITDQKGIITYANDNFCKISKYSREELIGKDHRIVNSGYHNKEFIKEIWTTIANGKIWRGDIKNKAKDGTTYWVETTIVPFLNKDEKPYQYVAIRADITERKKMEEQQQLFASIVNSSEDAILSKNLNGIITSWNKGAEKIFGYLEHEMIGKPVSKIIPSNLQHEENEIIQSIRLGKVVEYYETKRIRNDGKIIDVSITVSPIKDLQGSIIGASKIARDITIQKNNEAEILQLNADLDKKVLIRTNELLLAKNQLTETLESVRFLATIAENIQDPIISTDNNFIITKWNKAAEKLLEWKSEEVIGKPSVEILKTSFPFQTREQIIAVLNEKEFWQGEVTYYTKSGKPLHALATVSLLKDINNKIIGNLVLVRDITDRKIAEDLLNKLNEELEQKVTERTKVIKKREEQYHHLFLNNPMCMWVIEVKTHKFLDVNEMAILQYGYSRAEFLSMTALDIRPEEEKAKFLQLGYSTSKKPGNYNIGIWKHKKKDGTIIQVQITAHDLIFEGKKARIILAENVTVRKEAEEKLIASEKQLRSTLDNMLEGAQIIGFDWKYKYVNKTFTKHAKYKQEELLGFTVMEKFPGIEQIEIFQVYQRCFNERVSIHLENEFTFPDQTKGWFELSFQPVPEGIFILSIDITERKKAEQLLSENLKELERSNKELEHFAYIASHDLQEPLRMVGSYMQLIERRYKGKLDQDADEFIHYAIDGAARMKKLISDLLNYSRINKEVIINPINISDLMDEVIQNLSLSIKEKNAVVNYNELPTINADKTQMIQLFQNIISNALKFTKIGEIPTIDINAEKQNNHWQFSIKDNGIGIEQKYSEKIFVIFKQLNTKAKYGGTGIGLAIAKKIVERHGGDIWFESETGKGSTFYFTINTKIC